MAWKTDDIVKVNRNYVDSCLVALPSDPMIRQMLTSLNQLSDVTCKVLGRGWMPKSDSSGKVIYYIKVVPTVDTHIAYRPPHDGAGRGIAIYFHSLNDLESSFLASR